MPIYKDEPSNNGDDSVLITDLRRCRSIEDIDKSINKIIKPSLFYRLKTYILSKTQHTNNTINSNKLER